MKRKNKHEDKMSDEDVRPRLKPWDKFHWKTDVILSWKNVLSADTDQIYIIIIYFSFRLNLIWIDLISIV